MADEKKQETIKIMVMELGGWNRYGKKIKEGETIELTPAQYEDIKNLLKHKVIK